MNPLISVIVPVYNIEQYLCRCIDSVLQQSFLDFELILVNDGSTDTSGKICDHYQKKDERVSVIHQKNMGVSCARNSALEICKGNYITFIDGDDWLSLDTFTLVVQSIEKYDPDLVGFGYQIIGDGQFVEAVFDNSIKVIELDKVQACRHYLKNDLFYCGSNAMVFKRGILDSIFFRPSLTHGEDYIFAWQAFCKVKNVIFIDSKKYYYLQRAGSASHDYSEKRFAEIKSRKFVYQYICRSYPEMAEYAFEQYYKVILNMGKNFLNDDTGNKEYFYRIQRYVKLYFCRYFLGRQYSVKHKLFSVLLLFPYEIGCLVVPKLLRLLSRQGN